MDEDVEDLATRGAALEEDQDSNKSPSWRALFNFTSKAHILPLLAAITLSVASGIVVPVLSIVLGRLFNQFTVYGARSLSGHDLVHKVSVYALALVGLGSGAILLNAGYFGFWLVFGELQAKSVRDGLFDGLLDKDMAWFDMRKAGVNTLLSRLQVHIRELQMATAQPLGFTVQYTITTIAALGLALYYAWDLALITLSTVPIAAVALGWISTCMQTTVQGHIDGLTKASKLANVSISSIDTVKAFNGQDDEIFSYARAIKDAARLYLRQAQSNAVQIGFVRFTTLSLFVQGFWYGAHLINTGKKNPGDVLTAFWACLMATQTAEQILPQMLVLEKGRAAGATLRAALSQMRRGKKVVKMIGLKAPKFCDGDIQVRNVSFRYPSRPDQVVLKCASFFFGAGETTFIVGTSGSGKSTISNLLMQFYESGSGNISIDGDAIQILDSKWLRNNITLIQQQSVLFDETLFRNIAFGSRDKDYRQVSKHEVQNAMKTAYLQHVVDELPNGLDTLVGTGGSSLSGGQKQRVAIARARLRDTPILIIDEGTSALDHMSRTIVMNEIRKWRKGRTTIIITHDLSQIEDNDFVYAMSEGEVIQEGFRHALENIPNGLFVRLLQPETATSPSLDLSKGSSNPFDSTPASPISSRLSVDTIDSMDIEFRPRPKLLIPSIFGRPPGDSRSRRTSQGLISPISPTAFPMQRASRSNFISVPPRRTTLRTIKPREPQSTETTLVNKRLTLNLRLGLIPAAVHRASTVKPTAPQSDKLSLGLPLAFQDDSSSEESRTKDLGNKYQVVSLTKILLTVGPVLTWQKRAILIAGFSCAAIHAVATPMFSWVFAKLLATFSLPRAEQSRTALKWSLSVLGVAIVDSIASYFMHYLLEICGQAWIDTLRIQAIKRILDQPREWFDSPENGVSDMVESLDRNAEEMRNLLGRFAAFVFVAVIMLVIAIIWSLVLCWKLTLVALACAPFVYGITQLFETVSGKWEGRSNDAGAVASSIFAETFGNIRTVRSMTLEGYFHEKYTKATDGALRVGMKRSGFSGILFGISESGIIFITALVFYYGAVLASSTEFKVQDILTVFTMLLFSIANATNVIAFIPQIGASQDNATKLLRLANLPFGRSHEHAGNVRLPKLGPIIFKEVSFAYPARPESNVLNSLALTINPKTSTALVGSSGCGKSTIASLLLGLYPPTAGTITIAGLPTTALHLPTLRSLISVVPQSPILFAGTVAENIAYALPEKSPLARIESVRAAAISAGIDDFIMTLPQAYNSAIGDGGSGLSGGQTQRLAIARAIVRRPELLVLDEATSALDGESAKGIFELVQTLEKEGIGCLIVTHKNEMMRACKQCVVLGEGKVLEIGPYDQLMKRKGGEMRRLMGG